MQKPVLIILPGWSGSHETWKEFIALASKDFVVHCIDLPCFGDAPCPTEVWGTEEYAEYVEKRIHEMHLEEKPILLGHSFGGQVAVRVVSHSPNIFSRLILSAPAIVRPFHPLRRAFFYVVAKTGKAIFRLPVIEKGTLFAKKLLYKVVGSHDYEHSAEIKREIFKKIIRQDVQHLLPDISIPTLVVWGTKDGYLPIRDAKRIADAIPQAQLRIIEGGTHGLHIKNLETFLSSIKEFTHV